MRSLKILMLLLLNLASIYSLAQQTAKRSIGWNIGLSAQINGLHIGIGDNIAAEPGSTLRSSTGTGIETGLKLDLNRYVFSLALTNRFAKVVDNSASVSTDNIFRLVQDLHLAVGRRVFSSIKFFNKTSFSFGASLYSVGQPYLGGRLYKIVDVPIVGPILEEVTPSTIQFPAIDANYSKLFDSGVEFMISVSFYDPSWRPDVFGGKLITLYRLGLVYNFTTGHRSNQSEG